jgi:hypothetical protein
LGMGMTQNGTYFVRRSAAVTANGTIQPPSEGLGHLSAL